MPAPFHLLPSCLLPATFTAHRYAKPLIVESLHVYILQPQTDYLQGILPLCFKLYVSFAWPWEPFYAAGDFLLHVTSLHHYAAPQLNQSDVSQCGFTSFALFVLGVGLINISKISSS